MTLAIRRSAIALAIAMLSAGALHAADAPKPAARADIAIPDIPYTRFVLKNGLTLLVHEDHKTPVVAINTGITSARRMKSRARPASPTCSNT
ncbi:hypothetical protein [Duganella sp. P38]|uniref:hypothetical protein n=1 Tax=Duganella sp. P38 TaxID=3423949 RepID=UPI003D7B35AA